VREIAHRIEQVDRALPFIKKAMITQRQQADIFQIVLEKTLKYMHYDSTWIQRYINEHEDSSLGEGFRWYLARGIGPSTWQQILSNLKAMYEYLQQHPGTGLDIHYKLGLRARSPQLSGLKNVYTYDIDRDEL